MFRIILGILIGGTAMYFGKTLVNKIIDKIKEKLIKKQ